MVKYLFAAIFMLFSQYGFSEQPYKTKGRIPSGSPTSSGSYMHYVPYNATIISIEPENKLKLLASLAAHHPKNSVFYLGKLKDSSVVQKISQKTENLYVYPLSPRTTRSSFFKGYCKENGIVKAEVLLIDDPGNESLIFQEAASLLKNNIVISVTTQDSKAFERVNSYLEKRDYTLFSYWEDRQEKGVALFIKTAYFKGIYERKLM